MENRTLRDYLKVIFRHKLVIVATLIIVASFTYFKLQFITPFHTATVSMLVKGKMMSEVDYYKEIGSFGLKSNHAELIRSKAVLRKVVEALKLYERPLDFGGKRLASRIKRYYIDRGINAINLQLSNMTAEERREARTEYAIGKIISNMEVTVERASDIIILIVKDADPKMAALIANSISRSYIIFDLEQQVAELKLKYGDKNITVIQLKNYIEEMYVTLDGKPLSDVKALGAASVKVTSQALRGALQRPIAKKTVFAAAILASIVIGITLAFIIELLDATFKSPAEVESFLNIPVIGAIPKRKSKKEILIENTDQNSSDYFRSCQTLSDEMYYMIKDNDLKTILIFDFENSNDTPAIIANLGKLMAGKARDRVLIIDANIRSSSVSEIFEIQNDVGLSDVLEERNKFEDSVNDIGSNLYVLPVNETMYNSASLLSSQVFVDLIKEARERYDIILISCADSKNYKDAVVLSSVADGVVIVLNEGKARRLVVKELMVPFEQRKVNMIGAILNNRTYVLPEIIYRMT